MGHDRGEETNYRLTSCLCAPMIGYRLENDLLKNIRPDSRMEKFRTRRFESKLTQRQEWTGSGAGPVVWIEGVDPTKNASSHGLASSIAYLDVVNPFLLLIFHTYYFAPISWISFWLLSAPTWGTLPGKAVLRRPEPGIRNLEAGIENLEAETRNPEPTHSFFLWWLALDRGYIKSYSASLDDPFNPSQFQKCRFPSRIISNTQLKCYLRVLHIIPWIRMGHDRGEETNYRLTSCLCAPMIGYWLENDLLKNIRPDSRMEKFCTR
ncbi:hypothetical protein F2Q69_00059707 [Brassica cretica]|uniref:Uncharacterized protein n=1 Tax=Brassica cretica TaxID=69181 RepID=A0A8S9RAF3_BRACR|nr:hypothetical protein F2Q69_00059707 [Brassica cretica]